MRKFLLMSKVTLFCLLCSFSLESFSQALAANYAPTPKDKSQAAKRSFGKFVDIPVKGRVTGEDGSGLPGVSVVVKGTTIGTVTDADGNYSLNVPNENSVLSFSFIGYVAEEVTVGSQTSIDINLALDVTSLSEVVVTGYQSQNRRNITGAVSTVAAKDLVAIPAGNVEQQLQGRVAGVTVITSGTPGSGSQVRVRGFGSFTNNSPLYIIDGVPFQGDDIGWLNSNDIETTTVLKDAATASVYGARAASGVVVYTTKRGKANEGLKVFFDGSYGTQLPGKGYEMLNPTETMEAQRQALLNSNGGDVRALDHPQYGQNGDWQLPDYLMAGTVVPNNRLQGIRESDLTNPRPGYENAKDYLDPAKQNLNKDKGPIYQIIRANKAGTNWFDEITNPAPIQNYSLGLSNGSEIAKFYFGLGHYDQQGIVTNTYFRRTSLRFNSEYNIKNRIRIGESAALSYRTRPGFFGNLSEGNALSMSYRQNTLIPVRDENGGYAGSVAQGFSNPANPVAITERAGNNRAGNLTLVANVYGEVDLFKGLTFRTAFGGGMDYFTQRFITPSTYENAEPVPDNALTEQAFNTSNWVFTNTLNFKREMGVHNINAVAGVEAVRAGIFRGLQGSGVNPFSMDPNYATVGTTASSGRNTFVNASPGVRLFSLFAKADYTFNQKYLLSATVRRDASSVFGPRQRVGVFPAFSAGWILSEEGFLQNVAFVDMFKIRGGWGRMGNQAIGFNNQFNLYGTNVALASYDMNGSNTTLTEGFLQTNIGNPAGQWETNTTTNIGFDAQFLNGTLDIAFDWYQKKTTDLLFRPELPAFLGLSHNPVVNIGSMENSGIDLQVIKRGTIIGDLTYSADATFMTYQNTITALAPGVEYFDGSYGGDGVGSGRIGSGFTRNAVGQSVSAFYGYKVQGIFQNAEEVASAATQDGKAVGRFRYEDTNGDGAITPDDRTFFGNPNADFSYGLTLKLGFKGIEFETTFFGVQGQDIINYTRWFTDFAYSFNGAALGKDALYNSWSPSNPGGTTPMLENSATASNFSTNLTANSYYMEDGSYLRNRNMQIGYNFPSALAGKVGLERLKIYVQATNLFTFTKYKGLDPGVSGVDTNFGIDYGNYPVVKNFLFGLSLGL